MQTKPFHPSAATVRCRIVAQATAHASAETIGQWRRQPVEVGGVKLPASFLKHADDQTILALKTVLAALAQAGWQERSFADWAVVAAPDFFGRSTNAQAIHRYGVEGAWGISPHLIPHQSLHAMSGTISQALKIYGWNFGIGGGPNSAPDALLLAAALLSAGDLPGLWVVFTGYESEWIPAADGSPTPAPSCHAAVLALTDAAPGSVGPHLSFGCLPPEASVDLASLPELRVDLLARTLRDGRTGGTWRISNTHWADLDSAILEREAAA